MSEVLEALKRVRLWARVVADEMKETPGKDAYIFNGSMNDVEKLREELSEAECLLMQNEEDDD